MQKRRTLQGPVQQKRTIRPVKLPEEKAPPANGIRTLCGAKTRNGGTCKNYALANGRCRMHGGRSTVAKSAAPEHTQHRPPEPPVDKEHNTYHNLYMVGMHDDEQDIYGGLKVGDLSEELKLLRIKLRRAVVAQLRWEQLHDMVDGEITGGLDEECLQNLSEETRDMFRIDRIQLKQGRQYDFVTHQFVDTADRKIIRRKRDFSAEIVQLTRAIGRLEKQHAEITMAGAMGGLVGDREDFLRTLAVDLREFCRNADNLCPGGGPLGGTW